MATKQLAANNVRPAALADEPEVAVALSFFTRQHVLDLVSLE